MYPSIKTAEILNERLGLEMDQPGGSVAEHPPSGHPLLVDDSRKARHAKMYDLEKW
jgi:hypothetical protein